VQSYAIKIVERQNDPSPGWIFLHIISIISSAKILEGRLMLRFLKKFERIIVTTLIVMMGVTILLATIELAWLIIKDVITPPVILLEIHELLDIFGLFLLVLLGIELISTLKTYLTENEVHVEVVFAVALIAIGRKVIILDVKELSSLSLIGIAAIIISLSVGYFLVKRALHGKDSQGPGK
jgi:uncharacterized membrane protein (DUF373 family)